MKFENTQIFNFEGAFRGLRNPMNSWDKSDSCFGMIDTTNDYECEYEIAEKYVMKEHPEYYNNENNDNDYDNNRIKEEDKYAEWLIKNGILENRDSDLGPYVAAYIGPNDLALAQKLIKSGPEHRKFLRQILVSVDITAPMFWWSEFDTYKVGTTANSTSKMHKLASTPITIDCFEIDDYNNNLEWTGVPQEDLVNQYNQYSIQRLIDMLEGLRKKYLETKDVKYWKELIRWLPESWLQTRTVTMNYENIRNMYFQRKDHKLNEWSGKHTSVKQSFCQWVKGLPYTEELILFK